MKAKDYFEEKKSNMRELWNLSDTQKEMVYSLMEQYAEKLPTHDVMAMLPTESQLDEIAFRKYGNDPEGATKFNLIKRMAFVEGCEFMLRLLKGN